MKYLVQKMGPEGHTEALVDRVELESLLTGHVGRGYAAAVGNPRSGYTLVGAGVQGVLEHLDRLARDGEVRVLLVPQVVGG